MKFKDYYYLIVAFVIVIVSLFLSSCSVAEPTVYAIQGIQGEAGEAGETGNITEATTTDMTGLFYGDGANVLTTDKPTGLVVGTFDTQELDNKTLDSSVAKGTWTRSGTWTIPAVTLDGSLTINGQTFAAGAGTIQIDTTGSTFLNAYCFSPATTGAIFSTYHIKAPPANNDTVFTQRAYGRDLDNVNQLLYDFRVIAEDVTAVTASGLLEWYIMNDGVQNLAMSLSSNGTLMVDDSFDTFDVFDDALILKDAISRGNQDILLELGILKRVDIVDKYLKVIGQKYMIQLQPFNKLIAGGVYQNRDKIDALELRISKLEELLK